MRLFAALLAASLVLVARPALAQQWFHVDACETFTLNGQSVEHVTFSVHNFDAVNALRSFSMNPMQYQSIDTCHTLSLVAPPSWQVVPTGDHHPYWLEIGPAPPLAPGLAQGGFEMTLSRPACCFDVALGDPLAFTYLGETQACFDCANGATPSRASTWGSLKVLYR